jgi:uncharacterized protein
MISLLDVNVLVALAWPTHSGHGSAQRWFARNGDRGWATCPITQAGFVRVLSSPSFSPQAPTVKETAQLLAANLDHPAHRFWGDTLTLAQALERLGFDLVGHRQITDGYLLALAMHHKGKLVTLDKSISALVPGGSAQNAALEILT